MIEFLGTDALDAMGDFFSGRREEVRKTTEGKARVFALNAARRSKSQYLRGPRPNYLGRVSGTLAASVKDFVAREGEAVVAGIGTPVRYGPRWELGFKGTEQVRSHGRLVRKAFGKTLKSPVLTTVRAFARNVDVRARPYLRPAVMDELPWLQQDLGAGISKALSPGVTRGK
jgi:hypothetical protein